MTLQVIGSTVARTSGLGDGLTVGNLGHFRITYGSCTNMMKCVGLGMTLYYTNEKVDMVDMLAAYDKASCPPLREGSWTGRGT